MAGDDRQCRVPHCGCAGYGVTLELFSLMAQGLQQFCLPSVYGHHDPSPEEVGVLWWRVRKAAKLAAKIEAAKVPLLPQISHVMEQRMTTTAVFNCAVTAESISRTPTVPRAFCGEAEAFCGEAEAEQIITPLVTSFHVFTQISCLRATW